MSRLTQSGGWANSSGRLRSVAVFTRAKSGTTTHATTRILEPGSDHIDTSAWQPLLYVFRDYFGTGPKLGTTQRR